MATDPEELIVWYRPGGWSEAGVAEELLHIELRLDGFPALRGPMGGAAGAAATILSNCVDHQIIYPRLEAWGYSPQGSEREAALLQLNHVDALREPRGEPDSEAWVTMVLARNVLLAGPDTDPRLLERICRTVREPTLQEIASGIIGRLRSVGPGCSLDSAGTVLRESLQDLHLADRFTVERTIICGMK